MRNPDKSAYARQKATARFRGIPWLFTFETWIECWQASGCHANRGRGTGKYVMARFGDVGPYFPANVEIIRYEQNARDSRTNHPKSLYEMRSKQIGTGRGWTFVAGKYQVSVSKKYIGRFETVELAEAAYVQAAAGLLMSAECSNLNAGRNPASMESDRSKS